MELRLKYFSINFNLYDIKMYKSLIIYLTESIVLLTNDFSVQISNYLSLAKNYTVHFFVNMVLFNSDNLDSLYKYLILKNIFI